MKKIIIIEDDNALLNGLALALASDEIIISQCSNISKARDLIKENKFSLIILDINLPDGNGLEFMKEIKQQYDTPIIMLTANDTEADIVAGLELGADDYITKPFSLAVLRARVNTQLRKVSIPMTHYEIDDLIFDFEKMEFYKNSLKIELSKTEQKLLKLLVENKGITLQRTRLVERIWSDGAEYVDENALSVTIKRLRDKLEDNPSSPQYIKTVYGIGYVWMVK